MQTIEIVFKSVDQIQKFVRILSAIPAMCDLSCGRYVVDAKSIVGVMSLNLSKTLRLDVITDDAMISRYVHDNLEEIGVVVKKEAV